MFGWTNATRGEFFVSRYPFQLHGNVRLWVFSLKCKYIFEAIPHSCIRTEHSSKQSLCIKYECSCCFPPLSAQVLSKKLLHLLLCNAALPDTSQPSCSFPRSESSRAVEVFPNFPVLCQASYKDGCRKALHTYSLNFTYSVLRTFLHFIQ